jgi:uncharacterized protein
MKRIVYLHGFASGPNSGKARFFATQFLARGFTIEIPALDENDFERLTISRQLALLDRLTAGDPVSLIGSSMGGYLAALFAARHREVERLVLLAPAFAFARRWPETLGGEAMTRWKAERKMEVFHYGDDRTRDLHYGLIEDAAGHPEFPDFRQPALIFHGANDEVVPSAYSRRFAATHPNAHLEILDSGHELHNVLEYMAPRALSFLLGEAGS